jgi:hypothetical protein
LFGALAAFRDLFLEIRRTDWAFVPIQALVLVWPPGKEHCRSEGFYLCGEFVISIFGLTGVRPSKFFP